MWDTFAKERILKGSFDKFVQHSPNRKGTTEVDKDFLQSLDTWRDYLAKGLLQSNKQLTQDQLNFALQQTLDRIIFLRIAEDRGIEPYQQLRKAVSKGNAYANLIQVFIAADAKYNSGLFNFTKDTLTPTLKLENKILKIIVEEMYPPACPYEFSIIPVEILGNAYEQFLGKTIQILPGKRIAIEQKPEVRKAGGVYYTPQYIVQYIVEHTIGKLLANKTPSQIAHLSICDPACGSGSFLLGAYQFLLQWYLHYYSQNLTDKEKRSPNSPLRFNGNDYQLRLTEKNRILATHLFGVDIDANAVEVTKLSLLLQCLQGETATDIAYHQNLSKQPLLPSLENNICTGNSLVDFDYYQLNTNEDTEITPFSWKIAFPTVFKHNGFDAIIGNPPYARMQSLQESQPQLISYYKQTYLAAQKGNFDLYALFIEQGYKLLNKNGLLGFIQPHKFFQADFGVGLRQHLSQQQALHKVLHFGASQVFTDATTYTCLLFLSKTPHPTFSYCKTEDLSTVQNTPNQLVFDTLPQPTKPDKWEFGSSAQQQLLQKLKQQPQTLGDITTKIFQGIPTGSDKIFVLSILQENDHTYTCHSVALNQTVEIEKGLVKPFSMGKDVKRYENILAKSVVVFPYHLDNLKPNLMKQEYIQANFPLGWDYLLSSKINLENREKGRFAKTWFQFSRPQNLVDFAQQKIMTPDIANGCQMTYDEDGVLYHTTTIYSFLFKQLTENVKYFLGILNSKLLWYFLQSTGNILRGGFFRFKTEYLKPFPIHLINFSNPTEVTLHNKIVKLVDEQLSFNKQLPNEVLESAQKKLQQHIAYNDAQINQLVYQLYQLSPAEIQLVEQNT